MPSVTLNTLGDFGTALSIVAYCESCGRSNKLDLRRLIQKHGRAFPIDSLTRAARVREVRASVTVHQDFAYRTAHVDLPTVETATLFLEGMSLTSILVGWFLFLRTTWKRPRGPAWAAALIFFSPLAQIVYAASHWSEPKVREATIYMFGGFLALILVVTPLPPVR